MPDAPTSGQVTLPDEGQVSSSEESPQERAAALAATTLARVQAARGMDLSTSSAPATAPQLTAPAAAAPAAAPAAVAPAASGPPPDSWGSRVYHGVLSALGGQYETQFIPTANGVIKQQVASTPGQQWKRIISGALTGLGGAAAAGTQGPGGTMRGLGGGIQAGYGERIHQGQEQEKTANTQFEQEQKAAMQRAQTSMLAQQKLNLQWEMTKGKMEASENEVKAANEFEKVIDSGGQGTRFVAHAPDLQAAIERAKADPSVHDDHAGGYLQYNDHIDENGKHNGVDAYWIAPTLLDTKIPVPVTINVPKTVDGKVVSVPQTLDANTTRYRDYFNANNVIQSQAKEQALTEQAKASTANLQEETKEAPGKAQAEIDLKEAQAGEARSKTAGAATDIDINDAAEGLATGRYLMGKDIPLRTPKDKTDARQYAAAADKYSMEHFGIKYGPELVRQEASFANDKRTQAFLEAVDSMVGSAGMPGQLVKLQDLGKRAGLGGFGFAPGQSLKQWAYRRAGDDDAKAFNEALSDAQSKLGGLIGNPLLGGGESDLKLKTAQSQFGSDLTASNLVSQTKTAIDILENARARVVGRNRFLMQRYGPGTAAPGGNPAQPGPGGVTQPPRTPRGVPVIVNLPGGGQKQFANQAAADKFKLEVGIK